MNIIILCGGFGSRLGSLGRDNPKALLNIAGKPLIEWILTQLQDLDFIDAVHVLHNEKFKDQFSDWDKGSEGFGKVSLLSNGVDAEESRLGAVGDINFCLNEKNIFTPVVVFPGDTVFTFNVKKFFYELKRSPDTGWLSLRKEVSESERRKYGVVGLEPNGTISSFEEKPKESSEENVFKGPCYFPPTVTKYIPDYCSGLIGAKELPDNIVSFISWAMTKIKFKGCVMHSGECFDVGSYKDYRSATGRIRRSLRDDGEGYML